jgi:hypothetical protein
VTKPAAFYAWAVPAFTTGSPVDHTWVTTYDNRIDTYPSDQAVDAAGQFYWYCWGAFHPQGHTPDSPDGFLGQQAGDLALARCLVVANADSRTLPAARGTIFSYGVDGVCHQLANQVLFATGRGGAPLTVAPARGYMASTFIYGTYGLQHAAWANKLASCGSAGPQIAFAVGGGAVPGQSDDFETRARQVLEQEHPKLLSDLLALRTDTQRFAAQRWPGFSSPGPETLNARNQHLLDQAAHLLGSDQFKEIFGYAPDEKIHLVDPTIVENFNEGVGAPAVPPAGGARRQIRRPKRPRK